LGNSEQDLRADFALSFFVAREHPLAHACLRSPAFYSPFDR
jgi:hypothetical protein